MDVDDRSLVERVIGGEAGAWDLLWSRVERVVEARLSTAIARRPAAASERDDLRQAFRLFLVENDYRVLRTYEGRAALTTWIHCVAGRFFHRRAQKRIDPVADHPEPSERADPRTPEEAGLEKERVAKVRAAVADLGDRDRTILSLLFEQEASARTVGEMLGISDAGVRMQKKRLLDRLRARLEELAG